MDQMTRDDAVQAVGEKVVAMADRLRQAERWAPPESNLAGQLEFSIGNYRVRAIIAKVTG